ncbi:MAG: ORF6N domain-containing protein [Planctomycetaceae bacterium]
MRSQFATASKRNVRHSPFAFTEHGAFMAATVLNSPQAIDMSVFVVRTFVKLRHLVLGHQELAAKLDQLERKVDGHDESIKQIVAAIRQLASAPEARPRRMGFHTIRDRTRKEK